MKLLNVKVWLLVFSVIGTLAGIASFLTAEASAKLTYGSSISGSELYNLTTDQAGWSLTLAVLGLLGIIAAVNTQGVQRAKIAYLFGLIYFIENIFAYVYSSGRNANNPLGLIIPIQIISGMVALSGWVNRNNQNA
jgi:hypothetical protein